LWIECRTLLELDDLVILGDALISPWSPVPEEFRPTLQHLHDATAIAPRSGSVILRTAVKWVRPNCRSPGETRLRLLIVRAGLPEPLLNYAICSSTGRVLGTVDMAYPEKKLAIEYEGAHHFTDARQYHVDIERRELFAEQGWRTIRVTKEHLWHGRSALVERLARHLGVNLQK
jgi:hypothetical protein